MFDNATSRILLILALLLTAPLARAQQEPAAGGPVEQPPAAAARPVQESAELAGLAAEVEARYEVLPARGGLVLRPRSAGTGILSIEVADGEVAIDGEPVSRAEVRSRLGADAEAILRLAEVDPGEARALFRFGGPPPPPEVEESGPPRPPRPPGVELGQKVSILSSVTVRAGEIAQQAVAVGGSVTVDGEVDEDVVAVGGSARINGRVGASVVAVGGSVFLGPEADVGGDVVSVGGPVHRAEGARVGGETVQVSATGALLGEAEPWAWGGRGGRWFHWSEAADLVGDLVCFVVLLLLVWLVILLAQGPLGRIREKVADDPWRSALAGLLGCVMFVPLLVIVAVLLAISIIGIPLLVLIPVVILSFVVALLMGYAGVAVTVGRWLEQRFGWKVGNVFVAALVGMVAIEIWSFLADLLDVVGGPITLIATVTLVFSLVVLTAAWMVGLGAVILTRFGAGPRPVAAPAVLPPPAPPAAGSHDATLGGGGEDREPLQGS